MKVLVINAGSSSLKYQIIEMETETRLCKGVVERIGEDNARLVHEPDGANKFELTTSIKNHTEALKIVLAALVDKEHGVISDVKEIKAVGHRVLHAGSAAGGSVLIDDKMIEIFKENMDFGPLHMPANIACIESCREVMPNTPMAAVFDTGFHSTMPKRAYMYAIPYEDYEKYKIRKYGFHGTSHRFVSGAVSEKLGKDATSKMITCHLGNGSSIAAVKDGKCIDTSMGLTPLQGLMMGTRCGDIDAAVIEFMCNHKKITLDECMTILNKKSGFKGIADMTDCRDLCKAAEEGNERAILALDMFAYQIRKYIGSFYAALEGLDCIVFTGGIGENSAEVREMVMTGLSHLGIEFDFNANKNATRGKFVILTKPESKVKVVVMPTNEELVIARDAAKLSENK